MRSIEELTFDNTYSRLPDAFHQRVQPKPFENPWLVHFNQAAGMPPRQTWRWSRRWSRW